MCLCSWEEVVTIVAADMRHWQAPEKADILVSELLGSFGDNELSPECLDGAQRFLSQDGISIPAAYTSFIQPVTTFKLWNDVKVRCWTMRLPIPSPAPTMHLPGGGPHNRFCSTSTPQRKWPLCKSSSNTRFLESRPHSLCQQSPARVGQGCYN